MTPLTKTVVLRLQVDVQGSRFDSVRGERREISWRNVVPRIVEDVREGRSIDWGGTMVRHGDYVIEFDGLAREYSRRSSATKEALWVRVQIRATGI